MSGRADRPVPWGPYETEQQARADAAYAYELPLCSVRRGALADANLARLTDVCDRAGIVLGAFDSRILRWLANYEPEHALRSPGSSAARMAIASDPFGRSQSAGFALSALRLGPVLVGAAMAAVNIKLRAVSGGVHRIVEFVLMGLKRT